MNSDASADGLIGNGEISKLLAWCFWGSAGEGLCATDVTIQLSTYCQSALGSWGHAGCHL